MTLANWLTCLRLALVPVFIVTFMLPLAHVHLICAGLFALAALTDWLDGYLARALKQGSRFGAFLDPLADKLLVVTALIMMVGAHSNIWFSLAAAVMVGRELAVSALRAWMAEMQQHGQVAVSWLGKVKTLCQMLAILTLLAHPADLSLPGVMVGYLLLYIAAALTLWSMMHYLRAAWPTLRAACEDTGSDA